MKLQSSVKVGSERLSSWSGVMAHFAKVLSKSSPIKDALTRSPFNVDIKVDKPYG